MTELILTQPGPITTLTLNRPEKKNAFNQALLDALRKALLEVRDDPKIKVLVLKGAGGLFSSGIDHGFLMEIFQTSQSVPFRHLHHDLQDTLDILERMERPTIAVLPKYCVGLGLEVALACDFRFTTEDCVLGLPEVAFGIIPDVGGTTRLIRTVGLQNARSMILTGRPITGRRAAQLGLAEAQKDLEATESAASALATHLAKLPAPGVGIAKIALLSSAELDAATSRKMEGWLQSILLKDPALGDNFLNALALIKEMMAQPEDTK